MTSFHNQLSRRERQIMEVIYGKGEASAAEVQANLPETPNYSTVRALLSILEEKDVLCHREDGPRYVFLPTEAPEKARQSALRQVVSTYFQGSLANAVASLVDEQEGRLSPEEISRIEAILRKAKARNITP